MPMSVCSGRRCRVMIACVTFETAKVADPVKFYECNRGPAPRMPKMAMICMTESVSGCEMASVKPRKARPAMSAAPSMVAARIHQMRTTDCTSYFKHFLSI